MHNRRTGSAAAKPCFAGGKKLPLNTFEGRAVTAFRVWFMELGQSTPSAFGHTTELHGKSSFA